MQRLNKKLQTYERGLSAERLAGWYLRLKGYRILKRRWRTPVGEIDLLATRGKALVIVEVKHRATIEQALDCVSGRQSQRLLRAMHYAVSVLPHYAAYSWRCDLVALAPRHWPRHVISAWELQ